jgi:hypothetical protein
MVRIRPKNVEVFSSKLPTKCIPLMVVPCFHEILCNSAVCDEKSKSAITGLSVVCVMCVCVRVRARDLHYYMEGKITPIWGFSHWVD